MPGLIVCSLGLLAAGSPSVASADEGAPESRSTTLFGYEDPFWNGRAWDDLAVPAERSICFALYTTHAADVGRVLKMTVQLYPLAEGVGRDVHLEIRRDDGDDWHRVSSAVVDETPYGWPQADKKRWLAHFRVESRHTAGWDASADAAYRIVAADGRAVYTGTIRRDPSERDEIVVASLSCNSNQDRGARADIVRNLRHQDPDLLFFAGDQSYDHKMHLEAWLLFGRQFGELTRDRPTVTIPDDHDIGQGNLWGEGGIKASKQDGGDGGYFFSPAYINAVQAAQAWHLPDPVDPAPVAQGIGVYFTDLNIGGVDFAIVEDRKFKTGPNGLVRGTGAKPTHTNDLDRDPRTLDVDEAVLLGERQLDFLEDWGRDWTDASFKAVLSQTVFAQAAHVAGPGLWHGSPTVDLRAKPGNRMKFDFDSNGWPQSGRDRALVVIRKAFATHLCGDQHLATLLHHGVNEWNDAGVSFASPSIVNYFVRRWSPLEDAVDPIAGPLDDLGGYRDNFGNKITMLGYVNPDPDRVIEGDWGPRAEGYGLVRFRKSTREITYEVWPRMVDASAAGAEPYAGFPVTMSQMDQYGRRPVGYLPEFRVTGHDAPVFMVEDVRTGRTVYTVRPGSASFTPHVFDRSGVYRVTVSGQPGPTKIVGGLKPTGKMSERVIEVVLE